MFYSAFQWNAFQWNAFQIARSPKIVAGRAAKKRTRERHRAHLLAEKYNQVRQSQLAKEPLVKIVQKFVPEISDALPVAIKVDFDGLVKDRRSTRLFLEAIERIQIAIEEEEIFEFMVAL